MVARSRPGAARAPVSSDRRFQPAKGSDDVLNLFDGDGGSSGDEQYARADNDCRFRFGPCHNFQCSLMRVKVKLWPRNERRQPAVVADAANPAGPRATKARTTARRHQRRDRETTASEEMVSWPRQRLTRLRAVSSPMRGPNRLHEKFALP